MAAREPLATPAEVARYLRKSERTLANWRSLGIGPTYSGGRGHGVRYRWADVERYLRDQTTKTAS